MIKFKQMLIPFVALFSLGLNAQAGTVTGDYAINFAPLANADPYTNADFDQLSGSARIVSGLWRTFDNGTLTHWILDPGAYTFGDVIRAKIEIGPVGTTDFYDGLWALIVDSSGNGYGVRMGFGTTLTRLRWDAFAAAEVATETQAAADGDEIEIEYTKSTGALLIYYNGTLVPSLSLTDTTHAALTLQAGMAQRPQNAGDGGIRSFAADGVTTGPSSDVPAIFRHLRQMKQ